MNISKLRKDEDLLIFLENNGAHTSRGKSSLDDNEKIIVYLEVNWVEEGEKYIINAELEGADAAWIFTEDCIEQKTKRSISFSMEGPGKVAFVLAAAQAGIVRIRAHILYSSGVKSPISKAKAFFCKSSISEGGISRSSSDAISFTPIALSFTTKGRKELVDWNGRPAVAAGDGKAQIQVYAIVKSGDTAWTHGKVIFSIAEGEATFSGDGDNYSADHRVVTVPLGADGTTKPLLMTCSKVGDGLVIAELVAENVPGGVFPPASAIPYKFADPWISVSQVEARFLGSTDKQRFIYANGLHCTDLHVSMRLAGPDNTALGEKYIPENPFETAKLIHYDTGSELGQNGKPGEKDMAAWSQLNIPTAFVAPLSHVTSTPTNEIGDPAVVLTDEERTGGWVSKTYYITCSDNAKIGGYYAFGLSIAPSGPQIVAGDGKGSSGLPVAEEEENGALKFWVNGVEISSGYQRTITSRPESGYSTQHLDIIRCPFGAGNQYDKGPYYSDGTDDSDNYWRRWSFKISLKNGRDNSYIFQNRILDEKLITTDSVIAEKYQDGYTYQVYLWPTNIYNSYGEQIKDDGGKPIDFSGSFRLRSDWGETPVKLNDDGRSLYIDWYATFFIWNPSSDKSYSKKIPIRIYDQYGNHGDFTIDPSDIPVYNRDELKKWEILLPGANMIAEDSVDKSHIEAPRRFKPDMRKQNDFIPPKTVYLKSEYAAKSGDYYLSIANNLPDEPKARNAKLQSWSGSNSNIAIKVAECEYADISSYQCTLEAQHSVGWRLSGQYRLWDEQNGINGYYTSGYVGIFSTSGDDSQSDAFRCKITPVWETGEVLLYCIARKLHYFAYSSDTLVEQYDAYMPLHKLNDKDNRYRFKLICE
ncbi:hypothetical protein ACFSE0_20790 [Ochrobactrum teleogrylli]|uniref:Uncharacterized protein n=1 Tax=Ochrobactrum teleogrylli TaxID=2479765 RepID=A0ABY2Y313_9HYPH|nr:hypothetical protein [[Ochrobactrum] teleogrylli]TNV13868.1 hypothetical protein FIC94_14785 [[Ochrobactrum] teleogrylli]